MPEWTDNFTGTNGDPIDTNYWVSNSGLSIYDNKARGEVTSVDNDESAWLDFEIGGDFDIQVDLSCVAGCGSGASGWGAGMHVRKTSDDNDRGQVYFNVTSQQIVTRLRLSGSDQTVNVSNSVNSLKIRIVRVSGTWTIYHDNGSGWVSDNVRSGMYTGDVEILLWVNNWGTYPSGTADFDNFYVSGDSFSWETELSDFSMNLATVARKLKDLVMFLQAHNGLEYRDFQMLLETVSYLVQKDFTMNLETYGKLFEDFKMSLQAVKNNFNDFAMALDVIDGTVLKNFIMLLETTDGTVFNNFAMNLQVIKATPAFRSVTAHRVSSVVHEV